MLINVPSCCVQTISIIYLIICVIYCHCFVNVYAKFVCSKCHINKNCKIVNC